MLAYDRYGRIINTKFEPGLGIRYLRHLLYSNECLDEVSRKIAIGEGVRKELEEKIKEKLEDIEKAWEEFVEALNHLI